MRRYFYEKQHIIIFKKQTMSRLQLKNPPKVPHIEVTTQTWVKDSHGLFDYEALEEAYRKEVYYLKNNCKIMKDNTSGQTTIDGLNKADSLHPLEILVDKSKNHPEFKVKGITRKDVEHVLTPYLVVKDLIKNGQPTGYALKPGSVLKMGRVEYMVIEIKNQNQTFTLRDTHHFDDLNAIFDSTKQKPAEPAPEDAENNNCKTQEDPLISPCNCKGSCRLIHAQCLQNWISSKVKKDIKGVATSYNFTKFECQICKCPFPKVVRTQSKDLEMMTIIKPPRPYLLLESISNRQQGKQQRSLHLISAEQDTPIRIGRGHDCEIRITDISVSRKHAQIVLKDGQFIIYDAKAKFGTLIRLQQELILNNWRSLKVQCGRTVFQFKMKTEAQEDGDTE